MIIFKKYFPAPYNNPAPDKNTQKSNKGAITVEYAFGMALAAFFMIGIELLFRRMAIDIINIFKQLVTQFPNI